MFDKTFKRIRIFTALPPKYRPHRSWGFDVQTPHGPLCLFGIGRDTNCPIASVKRKREREFVTYSASIGQLWIVCTRKRRLSA